MVASIDLRILLAISITTSTAFPFPPYPLAQKAVALQSGFQPVIEQNYPKAPLYEPDLTELILLAGSADHALSLSDKGMKAMGWERGLEMIDVSHKANCLLDHALTYKKGNHCVAAFSANDDHEDDLESAAGAANGTMTTQEMCGFHINAGLALELMTYMQSPHWGKFLEYFIQPECETVTAVGHALGGAMASVFAACANVGQAGFGNRKDFGLITFGAFPPSAEPLYSGTPGTPFRGTRYLVSGLDGSVNSRDSMPANTKPLRLDILEFYLESVKLVGPENATDGIGRMFKAVSSLPETEVETFWNDNKIWQKLLSLGIDFKLIYLGFPKIPQHLELQPLMHVLLKKLVSRAELGFMYDPVGSWLSQFGYKHPLVDYQPVSNKLLGSVPLKRVFASEATEVPKVDAILSSIGMTLNWKPPNHQNCCYFQGNNCLWYYADDLVREFKGCKIPIAR